MCELISFIFGRDGFILKRIEEACGIIENYANQMLDSCESDMRLEVDCSTADNSQSKGVLEFNVYVGNKKRSYEALSGAEKTLIDVCLRVGLSRILAERVGIRYETLFFDEVFLPLDKKNRVLMMNLLKALT